MKKIASLLLALALTLTLTVPAFAKSNEKRISPIVKTADAVGVILNGKSIKFPDAQPYLKNGRTMVPYRALMEALGGKVNYVKGGTITCQLGDSTLSFKLSGKKVTVTDGDTTKTIQMDVPSFITKGRTYVPVRFFAKALGYDVVWDSSRRAAVLIDRQSLIKKIDENFTTINAALKKIQNDPTANYKSTASYQMDLNLQDKNQKAVSGSVKMNLTMTSSSKVVEVKGTVNASALVDALNLDDAVKKGTMTEAEASLLRSSLSNIAFEEICNLNQDVLYLHVPLLSALSAKNASAAVSSTNTWYQIPLNMNSLLTSKNTDATIGNVIYSAFYALMSQSGETAGNLYTDAIQAGNSLAMLLGDSNAVKSGESCTWTIDLDKLSKGFGTAAKLFKTFQVTLTSGADGVVTCTFNIVGASDADKTVGANGNMSFNGTGTRMTVKLDLGETGNMSIQMNLNTAKTSDKPAEQPPKGAKIVTEGGMLNIVNTVPSIVNTVPSVSGNAA